MSSSTAFVKEWRSKERAGAGRLPPRLVSGKFAVPISLPSEAIFFLFNHSQICLQFYLDRDGTDVLTSFLIVSHYSRRGVLNPAIPLPPCTPRPQSTNSFPFKLLSDPHPLSPAVSIFYKNTGGEGVCRVSFLQPFHFPPFFVHLLSFLRFTHSFLQRARHNFFGINWLRTLFIATGVYPPALHTKRKKCRSRPRRKG